MASSMKKLAKQEAQLAQLQKEASEEIAQMAMQTGAYRMDPTLLRKLLTVAGEAEPEAVNAAIATLKGNGAGQKS